MEMMVWTLQQEGQGAKLWLGVLESEEVAYAGKKNLTL
jgi:hypothetical protein